MVVPLADLNKQVAEASKRLVEAEAESREKFNRDPIVAAAIIQVELYVVCVLPLVLADWLV